jgi:O-acetylserine/cysteine efflux transporter
MLLVFLRYVVTLFPAIFFTKKPKTEWKYIISYGLFVGVLQFSSLFYALEIGMPAGLASIILQFQAFVSPVFAMIFLNEKLKAKQVVGSMVAVVGLLFIAMEAVSGEICEIPLSAVLLTFATPVFWALSNVISRIASEKAAAGGEELDMFGLVVWSSLVPPIPILILALMIDSPEVLWNSLVNLNGISVFAVLYLAFGATLMGYGIWAKLIANYPMGMVAPISLLVPIIGLLTARIVLLEQLTKMQWGGVSIILIGLVINNLNLKVLKSGFEKFKTKSMSTD